MAMPNALTPPPQTYNCSCLPAQLHTAHAATRVNQLRRTRTSRMSVMTTVAYPPGPAPRYMSRLRSPSAVTEPVTVQGVKTNERRLPIR
jgi:hypothetical protein